MEFKKVTLEDICLKITDGAHYSPKATDEGYPMYSVKDMKYNAFDNINSKLISEKDYQKLVKQGCRPEKNDVVIAKDGSYLKHVFVISDDIEAAILSSIAILKLNLDLVNPYYLSYFLKQKSVKEHMKNGYVSGSVLPRIILKDFKKYPISLPHLKIQNKVVEILKKIDSKIDNNQRIIANLEDLSQTLFKRWFVDFEFPDENGNPYKSSGGDMIDSELGEIPSGWKVDELGNYIKIKSGKRPKNKVDKKDIENVVPIIGASKIMGYTNDYLYNEKIIIIGRVGTHGVIQRFSTRTWPSDNTFVIISDFESIIYQVLKSIDYISLNRGSTQPLLSQKDIKNTKVAMPTNETLLSTYQKENNHILKMMNQKNIENQKLTQLRDTLLPKLMSGEIEIPNDIEVNEDELSI